MVGASLRPVLVNLTVFPPGVGELEGELLNQPAWWQVGGVDEGAEGRQGHEDRVNPHRIWITSNWSDHHPAGLHAPHLAQVLEGLDALLEDPPHLPLPQDLLDHLDALIGGEARLLELLHPLVGLGAVNLAKINPKECEEPARPIGTTAEELSQRIRSIRERAAAVRHHPIQRDEAIVQGVAIWQADLPPRDEETLLLRELPEAVLGVEGGNTALASPLQLVVAPLAQGGGFVSRLVGAGDDGCHLEGCEGIDHVCVQVVEEHQWGDLLCQIVQIQKKTSRST